MARRINTLFMKARQLVFLCMLVLLPALGCSLFTGNPTTPIPASTPTAIAALPTGTVFAPTIAPPTGTPTAAALTLDLLKNFTYSLEYSPDGKIPLKDGSFELSTTNPPVHITSNLGQQVAFGDLNGDGLADAVVTLATNTGGSGTFINIVAVLNAPGGPAQAATVYLDDRASVKAITIANGQIQVDYIGHGPNDPLCCPSLHLLRVYRLQGAELALISESNP